MCAWVGCHAQCVMCGSGFHLPIVSWDRELSSQAWFKVLDSCKEQGSSRSWGVGIKNFLPGPRLRSRIHANTGFLQKLRCVPVKGCVHTSQRFSPCRLINKCLSLHYGNQIYVSTSNGNLNVVSSWLLALSCGITYPEQLCFSWLN